MEEIILYDAAKAYRNYLWLPALIFASFWIIAAKQLFFPNKPDGEATHIRRVLPGGSFFGFLYISLMVVGLTGYFLKLSFTSKKILESNDVNILQGYASIKYPSHRSGSLEIDGMSFSINSGEVGGLNLGSFENKCRRECIIKTGMRLKLYYYEDVILRVIQINEEEELSTN